MPNRVMFVLILCYIDVNLCWLFVFFDDDSIVDMLLYNCVIFWRDSVLR